MSKCGGASYFARTVFLAISLAVQSCRRLAPNPARAVELPSLPEGQFTRRRLSACVLVRLGSNASSLGSQRQLRAARDEIYIQGYWYQVNLTKNSSERAEKSIHSYIILTVHQTILWYLIPNKGHVTGKGCAHNVPTGTGGFPAKHLTCSSSLPPIAEPKDGTAVFSYTTQESTPGLLAFLLP